MSTKIILIFSVFVFLCDICESKPADADAQAQILKFDNDVRLDGYDFAYETSNGIKRTESGVVKPGSGPEDALLNVNGEYSFNFPDGTPFTLKFVSSENGYRPVLTIGQPRSG